MDLFVRASEALSPGAADVEVVERKGLGHPDSICDALTEEICIRLCRFYTERFGVILHHNVDKILLCAGSARPAFGGGDVIAPIDLYLAGRATMEHQGQAVPVAEIAVDACKQWLRTHLRLPDVDRNVRVFPRFRPGSGELTRLFGRHEPIVLANDTSCGAGFAPLTDLERVVLSVERSLNSPDMKTRHPAIGEDIKVMGIRRGARIDLTIGCAMVDRFLRSIEDYTAMKAVAHDEAIEAGRRVTKLDVHAVVNAADGLGRADIYMTVTGTSAEAGDDGEVGRGNRASGLITPYRPMTLEATAGKNPVNHVGKLYNLAAGRIADSIVKNGSGIADASCVLVSQIGRPIDDPALADVVLRLEPGSEPGIVQATVREIVSAHLGRFEELRQEILSGKAVVH